MLRSVLIAERSPSGHRLVYVRLLVEGARVRGIRPELAVSREVLDSQEYIEHLGEYGRDITAVEIDGKASIWELQKIARERGAERLLLPDSNWRIAELVFGRRARNPPRTLALMMRDPCWELLDTKVPRARTLMKLMAFRFASWRSIVEVIWLREPGHVSEIPHANDPVLLEADVETIRGKSAAYRRRHGLTEDIYWFGIAGMISESKQPSLVARAAIAAGQQTGRKVGLALLGPLRMPRRVLDELEGMANSKGLAVVSNLELHSNYEMNVAVGALDCVVAAYVGAYGPSSTLGKAAALGVASVGAGSKSQRMFAHQITGYDGVAVVETEIARSMIDRIRNDPPLPRAGLGPEQFLSTFLD